MTDRFAEIKKYIYFDLKKIKNVVWNNLNLLPSWHFILKHIILEQKSPPVNKKYFHFSFYKPRKYIET